MPTQSATISAAVGTRNGAQPLLNRSNDLATITALFDCITSQNGGTSDAPGVWPTDRSALIAAVTTQIATFQSSNNLQVDWAIDPSGGALRLMCRLAVAPPPAAYVVAPPGNYEQDNVARSVYFASVSSMPGTAPLAPTYAQTVYSRRLVSVTGCSIKWFGVVLPASVGAYVPTATPHIFFTPTPAQGGYDDSNYDSFTGWGKLWSDYTDRIGGLVSASGVNQILVIPFYKTSQAYDLGSFMVDWRAIIAAVIAAAVKDINPYYLTGDYSFDYYYCSSFSNGIGPLRRFYSGAPGAQAMATKLYDLDGSAQTGGSSWRPSNGVIYINSAAPAGSNPAGPCWYVGGRWGLFDQTYVGASQDSHHRCAAHLLYHGLSQYGS